MASKSEVDVPRDMPAHGDAALAGGASHSRAPTTGDEDPEPRSPERLWSGIIEHSVQTSYPRSVADGFGWCRT